MIPDKINLVLQENVGLAVSWRQATRNAFARSMAAGLFVDEFYRAQRGEKKVGVYLLSATGPAV